MAMTPPHTIIVVPIQIAACIKNSFIVLLLPLRGAIFLLNKLIFNDAVDGVYLALLVADALTGKCKEVHHPEEAKGNDHD